MNLRLRTARLVLRPLTPADRDSTFAYTGDRRLNAMMFSPPHASPEETDTFLARAAAAWADDAPDLLAFAVERDGVHIGGITLFPDTDGEAEIGWIFLPSVHGKGYATEAAAAVRDYARDVLGCRRLVAHCDIRNLPSIRVMERLGMRRTDYAGHRPYCDETGEPVAELQYAMNLT